MGQRVQILIGQAADAWLRVRVDALLMVHDPVDRILPPGLPDRAPSTGPARTVARYNRASFHASRCHRLRRHAAVVLVDPVGLRRRWWQRLRLRVLDAVQWPRLLFLLPNLSCAQRGVKKSSRVLV